MGGRKIVVRILGLVSTARGFAYALTEGPGCLVNVGLQRTSPETRAVEKAIDAVLVRARALFVAFDGDSARKKRQRGWMFVRAVTRACQTRGPMLLAVSQKQVSALSAVKRPTKWDVAEAIAKRFPEIADRLPPKRKAWQTEEERIGIFIAVAAAVAAWESFRGGG
jgi:hypothetical protein